MYLAHLATSTVVKKFLIPFTSSPCFFGFTLACKRSSSSYQRFSMGLTSGGSGGVRSIYTILFHKCGSMSWHMLGVTVLHEHVLFIMKLSAEEWQEYSLQHRHIRRIDIRDLCENDNTCGSLHADSSPYVHLHRVFSLNLGFGTSHSFLQHLLRCVSSCTDASSLQMTFLKSSLMYFFVPTPALWACLLPVYAGSVLNHGLTSYDFEAQYVSIC